MSHVTLIRKGGQVVEATFVRFGEIEVNGQRYDRDVVIAGGTISKRHKKPSFQINPLQVTIPQPLPFSEIRLQANRASLIPQPPLTQLHSLGSASPG